MVPRAAILVWYILDLQITSLGLVYSVLHFLMRVVFCLPCLALAIVSILLAYLLFYAIIVATELAPFPLIRAYNYYLLVRTKTMFGR